MESKTCTTLLRKMLNIFDLLAFDGVLVLADPTAGASPSATNLMKE